MTESQGKIEILWPPGDERIDYGGPGAGPLGGDLWLQRGFDVDVIDSAVPYRLTVRIIARRGRLVVESLTIRGDTPVNGAGLRRLRLEKYLDVVRTEMGQHAGLVMNKRQEEVLPDGRTMREFTFVDPSTVLTRRRERPEDSLPIVAQLYREAEESADAAIARAPTQYVADRLHYSRGHASRLVSQARRAGLLKKASVR